MSKQWREGQVSSREYILLGFYWIFHWSRSNQRPSLERLCQVLHLRTSRSKVSSFQEPSLQRVRLDQVPSLKELGGNLTDTLIVQFYTLTLFDPHNNPEKQCYFPHFIDEETKVLQGEMIPRIIGQLEAEPESGPVLSFLPLNYRSSAMFLMPMIPR